MTSLAQFHPRPHRFSNSYMFRGAALGIPLRFFQACDSAGRPEFDTSVDVQTPLSLPASSTEPSRLKAIASCPGNSAAPLRSVVTSCHEFPPSMERERPAPPANTSDGSLVLARNVIASRHSPAHRRFGGSEIFIQLAPPSLLLNTPRKLAEPVVASATAA